VLFYTGNEDISGDVQLVIPMEGVKEDSKEFLEKVNGRYVGNLEFYGDQGFVKKFTTRRITIR